MSYKSIEQVKRIYMLILGLTFKELNLPYCILQIRWLMSIRSPAKIFFQIIVPPILMIIGLSILRGAKSDNQSVSGPQPLKLTPEMYLKPGGKEDYASYALLQNSTKGTMDNVMSYLSDYSVGTVLVPSISAVLSSSSNDLYSLGFNIRKFPADFNLSQPNVSTCVFALKSLTIIMTRD